MSDSRLKVMLVDDEYLTRELLRRCINWNEIGMEIVSEASNAYEALDIVDKIIPDIIITDICMPFMDGIEFSKAVIERHPHIKIVILTGYEEFEYAKRSIKVGAADFLLKPINHNEIKKAALNIKEKIEAERTRNDEYRKLKKQLDESMPYLREIFLNELLQGRMDENIIQNKLLYFQIDIKSNQFQTAVIEIIYTSMHAEFGEEDILLLRMHCIELIKQYFRNKIYTYVFFDISQRIVILNNDKDIDLIECCENIKNMIVNRLNCFVCIGVGNSYEGIKNIRNSYREAIEALNYKVIAGKNQVMNYNDITFPAQRQLFFFDDQIDDLGYYLKVGMEDKAIELVETLYDEIASIQTDIVDIIRVIGVNIISTILNTATKLGINIKEVFHNGIQPYKYVFKIDTIPEMKNYLKSCISGALKSINSFRNSKVSKIVKEIQNFLIENYADPEINLLSVAKMFYLNPSYLSRLFRQETGQTFVEYLTRIRIKKAIELLKETDMKVYEVAEKVGIIDPHYFGICFKKYLGMSVSEFKKCR
ncbi:MAG TPA: response regulator [Clostridiaceae bacterium]|nr:response regulator [Clostridiaceae bacterium]